LGSLATGCFKDPKQPEKQKQKNGCSKPMKQPIYKPQDQHLTASVLCCCRPKI